MAHTGRGIDEIMSGWRAGAASAEFDVPIGTPMAGYAARVGGSAGTLDPLGVGALALSDGEKTFVIIAVDLLGIDRELVDEIEHEVGIEPGWLGVCASHTHSGPAGITKQVRNDPDSEIDHELRRRFIDVCVDVARKALAALEDAELSIRRVRAAGISANRNSANGPYDDSVRTIQARALDGRVIATLVHFACHPTILPASSNLISAEFPGMMRRFNASEYEGEMLFVNGAAGDVSTRFTRESQNEREIYRVGSTLKRAAIVATQVARPIAPVLSRKTTEIELAPRDPAEIRAIIDDARAKLEQESGEDSDPSARRIAETRAQGIEILERVATNLPSEPIRVSIPRWSVGQVTLFGIPGELFASLGELCTGGDDHSLILGYTNGYLGYFADRAAYNDGLYEALASPLAPGASEIMVERLLGDR